METYFYNIKTGVIRKSMHLTEDKKWDVPDRANWVTINLNSEQFTNFIVAGIIKFEK